MSERVIKTEREGEMMRGELAVGEGTSARMPQRTGQDFGSEWQSGQISTEGP